MTTKHVTGLDAEGKVVEELEQAVIIIEQTLDEAGNLVSETIGRAEGADLPPVVSKPD